MKQVAQLSITERKELFSETAMAMNMTPAAAEKDFWICWVLAMVFGDVELSQLLRFKGGTSLSKCYQAIERFSEDIDLILDWSALTSEDPESGKRSKTKQGKLNQTINQEAQAFIAETLLPRCNELMGDICTLELDGDDPHTINIIYPKAFQSDYLRPQVRLEVGPLAAMLPMEMCSVQPYAADHFPAVFQQASISVPTITAARTFWEKLTILHAEAHRPADKALASRYARHYYDVHRLYESGLYKAAIEQPELLAQVVAFKEKFYPSAWASYGTAVPGQLRLQPSEHHLDALRQDYAQMQEMLFGDKPSFDSIINTLNIIENEVNILISSSN